jgi:cell division septation protein DedD
VKTNLSQSGSVRFILIGVLVVLVALVGAAAWFGYNMFKLPSPEPAGQPAAVRSKIPAPPAAMKIPQPQKIETPELQPQPETRAGQSGQPIVTGETRATSVTASDTESGQVMPPERQTAPVAMAAPTPSAAEATEEPDPEPGSDPEIVTARNDQGQEAPPTQPTLTQTEAASVGTEEKTAPPPAPKSPALEVKPAPEKVAAVPAEQKKPAAEKAEPALKTATAKTDPQKPAPFTIQVGAYLTKAYAEEKQTDLEQRGYEPFVYQTRDKQQRTWYMVRVGHFEDRPAAEMFLSDFTAKENMPAVIARSKKR